MAIRGQQLLSDFGDRLFLLCIFGTLPDVFQDVSLLAYEFQPF